jgi:hypothetical protein
VEQSIMKIRRSKWASQVWAPLLVAASFWPFQARPLLIREVRAVQAELKGFGYVEIAKQKWCIVSAEAELMEATSGRPIGEAYFGTRDQPLCAVLWDAAKRNLKVDISGIPEKHVIDPLFLGSVKKIYIIGFAWVRSGKS